MAQSVFRANQVTSKKDKVLLKLTREFAPPVVEVEEEVPEYTGPTADDLRREAEEFKKQWEADKQDLIAKAQEQADAVVKKAEEAAFGIVKKQTDQAQVIKTDAEKQAASIIAEAEEKAQKIISDAKNEAQSVLNKAEADGLAQGRDKGYAEGYEEADRLVKRLHTMVEAVGAKRQEILDSTEQQIVELVLLMTRKVVKILSENQKSVILSNVVQALKKVRGRREIVLKVNLADVQLTTAHIKDFIREVESVKAITVVEDSSVEKGGCIVETDFGAIDARISSQLSEIESKVLEVAPIKSISKSDMLGAEA